MSKGTLKVWTSSLVKKVARAAARTRLIERGDRILVAVSGGPDSVALLSVLAALRERWGLALAVAHFNYGLRGSESDEDQRFVAGLCAELGIPCRIERLDLSNRKRGGSLQEYARELRYQALLKLAREMDMTKIALGHTLDDQAETVLMWMLRGAGTSGLGGIRARRAPGFIRPLLGFSRAQLISYLEEEHQGYRTDSSNAKPVYLRNRVRSEILPVLKKLNPGVVRVLTRQADILQDDDQYLEDVALEEAGRLLKRHEKGAVHVDRDKLVGLPVAIQRRVVRHALRLAGGTGHNANFNAVGSVLDGIVNGRSGSQLNLRGLRVVRSYGTIQIAPSEGVEPEPSAFAISVSVPDAIVWPMTRQRLKLDWTDSDLSPEAISRDDQAVAILDADRFTPQLQVRTWRDGDVFCPLGMSGRRKKLQDFFIDQKVPRHLRGRLPIIEAPEGILWIGGYRIDHRFRVTPMTRRRLILRLSPVDAPSSEQKAD